MKKIGSNKLIKAVVISILMTSINSTNSYAAGRSTTLPANTVLSGRGVPSATIGLDGDFYIDTKSLNIYGPKTKSKWPIPVSLKGPSGPIGPAGVDGKMEPLVYLLLAVAHLAQPVQPVQLAHKEHKETQVQLVQPDQQVVEGEVLDLQDQKGKQELLVWLGLRMFNQLQ